MIQSSVALMYPEFESQIYGTDIIAPVVQSQLQDKDKYGNLVMRLDEVGLTTPVRFVRTESGPIFSEIDVTMNIIGKNNKQASQSLERLPEEIRKEVSLLGGNLQFKGPGQKVTTLITFQGVLKLIMALNGGNAREMRTKFSDVLLKYFAGDASLVQEIAYFAASDAPINQLAREAQAASVVTIEAPAPPAVLDIASLEQRILSLVRKTDVSERRKQLYDNAQTHKRKLDEIDHASRVAVKERKDISQLVVSEKEAIVAAEIRQTQEERLTIEAKAELERKQLQEERLNIETKAQLELKQLEAKAQLELKQTQEERLNIEAKAQHELKQLEAKMQQEIEGRKTLEAKAELELKQELEGRKTVEAQTLQEIEERKKIEAQIELHKLMMMQQPASSGAKPGRPAKSVDPMELALANEPKVFTFLSVAEYNKIFSDVTPEQKAAILKRAPTDRYDVSKKVKSIGTIPEGPEGKMVDYFRKTDAPVLLRALEIAKRALLEQERRAIEEERMRLAPPIEYPEQEDSDDTTRFIADSWKIKPRS